MNPLVIRILIYLCIAAGLGWGLKARVTGQPAGDSDTWIIIGCFAAAAVLSILFRLSNKKD